MKYEPMNDHAERKRILALMEQCEKKQTMKLITIYPNNKPYYSEDFIKGFKCGAQRQFETDKANIDLSEYSDKLWHNAYERGKADRPHGEWIEHKWAEEVEGLLISNYECSECHSWERRASDFCPNCGAKMKGEDRKE